jgi:predicted metalloendopeptidase
MWRVVHQYTDALPASYMSAKQDFTLATTGVPSSARWGQCMIHMMHPFDMTLGLLYVDAHFSDDSKKTVSYNLHSCEINKQTNKMNKQCYVLKY